MIQSYHRDIYIKRVRGYTMGIIFIVLSFYLTACSFDTSQKDFSGTWDSTEWGVLEMERNGDKVSGHYEYVSENTPIYGQLEGQIEGEQLNLTWWQSADKNVTYAEAWERGTAYYILGEDGDSLEGEWGMEGQDFWSGHWNFVRR